MAGLRESQELAADFAYERDSSILLGRVGSGKTAAALVAMQHYKDQGIVKRWLVLAPKRVCEHVWPVEAKLWSNLSVNVAVGNPQMRRNALDGRPKSDIVVINYDNLQWLAEQYPDLARRFDGVVFDELTRLKNPSGKRFKAFLSVADGINIRIGLTGSFTSNGLQDVFGQVHVVDKSVLGRSRGAFMQQYFWCANPQFGEWVPRPGSFHKIMDRIKPVAYLMDNETYVNSLPPLNVIPVPCVFNNPEPYKKMKNDFVLQFGTTTITAINGGVVTQKLSQLASGFVYSTDVTTDVTAGKFKTSQEAHWFDDHKMQALDDLLVENQLANTLVFYNFKEELAELKRRYPQAETLDAPDAVQRWNDGRIPLLLAHPASAGHGLNLQFGGSQIVFTSLPWSLELYEQAIGRLHRSGQKQAVYVYCLLTEGTIDYKIFDALNGKAALSDIAINALKNS